MIYEKLKAFGRAIVFQGNKKRGRPTTVVTSANVTFSLVDSPKGSEVLEKGAPGVTLNKEDLSDPVWNSLLDKHKTIMAALPTVTVTLGRENLLRILEAFTTGAVVLEFAPRAISLGKSKRIITDSGEYLMTCNSERYCDVVRVREVVNPHNIAAANTACIIGVTCVDSVYGKDGEDEANIVGHGKANKEDLKASLIKTKQLRKRVSKHTARRKKSQERQLKQRKER